MEKMGELDRESPPVSYVRYSEHTRGENSGGKGKGKMKNGKKKKERRLEGRRLPRKNEIK